MIEIIVEDYDLKESQIGTGDQESRALVATKAKWQMRQALKGGKKQSQAWWNKQVKLADIDANDKPVAVIQKILNTKEEVVVEERELNEVYGTVKITKKVSKKFKTYKPYLQHMPGEIIFVGNRKQALSKLKDLKKDGEVGYIMQGVSIKVGEKVKGLERGRSTWAGDPKMRKEDMSTASDVDMNPTGKPKKKKCETFNVSDDCFNKFKNGKTKFERWSRYLDLEDASQKKIYDWAKKHHNGTIILQNSVTGQVRGIRYNRTGGGQWGTITRLKEQVLQTNKEFKVK